MLYIQDQGLHFNLGPFIQSWRLTTACGINKRSTYPVVVLRHQVAHIVVVEGSQVVGHSLVEGHSQAVQVEDILVGTAVVPS